MTVPLLPAKRNILLYLAPVAVFCMLSLSCLSQDIRTRTWKAIVFTGDQKVKGILFQVSDSSVVLSLPDKTYSEILFSRIHKIRLRRRFGEAEKLVGFLAGAGTGAAVLATMASKGRQGEPGALAGVYGGFLGFLLGGGIGIAVATPVYRLISTRTYIIPHDPLLYPSLAAKLRRRSLRR